MNKKCLVLNPYTKTLKIAEIPQTLANWYAIMGTRDVQQFYLQKTDCAVLYADDILGGLRGITAGTEFKDWDFPVMGILLFVGPPDDEGETTDLTEKAIAGIREAFKLAKIRIYKI